jgi:hypothetical protein
LVVVWLSGFRPFLATRYTPHKIADTNANVRKVTVYTSLDDIV